MAPFAVKNDGSASKGEYVVSSEDNFSASASASSKVGILNYNFTTDSRNTYYVWARVKTPSPNDDSFFGAIDSNTYAPKHLDTHTSWAWVKFLQQVLGVGDHTLKIKNRENGTLIDRVVVTDNGSFIPTTGLGS
jgi:hypothetical protein